MVDSVTANSGSGGATFIVGTGSLDVIGGWNAMYIVHAGSGDLTVEVSGPRMATALRPTPLCSVRIGRRVMVSGAPSSHWAAARFIWSASRRCRSIRSRCIRRRSKWREAFPTTGGDGRVSPGHSKTTKSTNLGGSQFGATEVESNFPFRMERWPAADEDSPYARTTPGSRRKPDVGAFAQGAHVVCHGQYRATRSDWLMMQNSGFQSPSHANIFLQDRLPPMPLSAILDYAARVGDQEISRDIFRLAAIIDSIRSSAGRRESVETTRQLDSAAAIGKALVMRFEGEITRIVGELERQAKLLK